MDQKSNKYKPDSYFDLKNVPEEWFLPISELTSERCKQYMDEEARLKTLKVTYEAMVKSRQKERGKK